MIKLHSVASRIIIGKIIGLIIGIVAMLSLPLFDIPIMSMFGLGTLIMFVLMGALTGFMGIFDRHPMIDFKMPWWFRGPLVGATFLLMYVLFTYDTMELMMQSSLVSWIGLKSPFWAILDGIFIGGLMGFVETKLAGEGKDLPLS
jgi:hypothetical protein